MSATPPTILSQYAPAIRRMWKGIKRCPCPSVRLSVRPCVRPCVLPFVQNNRRGHPCPMDTFSSSRKRHTRFLEKKLAGKPDLALPEEKSITTVPGFPDAVDSLCVKELENTSPVGGSSRDLVSLEDPTSSPDSDPDLSINERAILRKFLDTVNTDSEDSDDDLSSVHCASCKRPPEKGEELKRCLRCHIARYFSVQCQRKDWDFHRFACSVVAKRSDTVKA